jgi:mono/diheme cytochrome c family protein
MMFPQNFWRNVAWLWLSVVLLLVLAVLMDNHRDVWEKQPVSQNTDKPLTTQVNQGQTLLNLGNCLACHTERGQPMGVGGRAFETPFGSVYSSNLTPHLVQGLGTWQADDFWRALHYGKSKDGRLLTPVFPYKHTTLITRDDSDAMFAALKTLQPETTQKPIPKVSETLAWPYNSAVAIAIWRSLFFSSGTYKPQDNKSNEWNRGAYLAQGLGHCAACHSPRNAWGASGEVNDFSGGLMPLVNWYAPSLLSAQETGLAQQSISEIALLLKSGQNVTAVASGPMAEVVQHSTQHWPEADLLAVATYLKEQAQTNSVSAITNKPPITKSSGNFLSLGAKIYEQHCEQCHQAQGQGVTHAYPALAQNRAILLSDPTNLVQAVLYGGYPAATTHNPRPFGMPPFVLTLEDQEIAAVLTHLRSQWGNQAAEVTPLQVNRIRALQGR